MFPYWNLTTHLPIQEEFMIPFHLLKSMVNKHMKWMTFWIQGFIIVKSNILFISMGIIWMDAFGNQCKTYQMPWKRFTSFINDIQTSPSLFFVELVTRRGNDVIDANAMKFIHMSVHPWLVMKLHLTLNLVLVHSQLTFN